MREEGSSPLFPQTPIALHLAGGQVCMCDMQTHSRLFNPASFKPLSPHLPRPAKPAGLVQTGTPVKELDDRTVSERIKVQPPPFGRRKRCLQQEVSKFAFLALWRCSGWEGWINPQTPLKTKIYRPGDDLKKGRRWRGVSTPSNPGLQLGARVASLHCPILRLAHRDSIPFQPRHESGKSQGVQGDWSPCFSSPA